MRAIRLSVQALLAAAVLALPGAEKAVAIDGATQNPANGHWYKRVGGGNNLTWQGAKSAAVVLGGHLATVTSAAENQWLVNNGFAGKDSYIGGTDEAVEGTWRWVTGEPFSYTNWRTGEPNDDLGGEDYLSIWGGGGGQWNDLRASGTRASGYIVEWESGDPPPPPPPPPAEIDLAVRSMTYSPESPAPGEKVEVGYTVENRGNETASRHAVKLELIGYERDDDAPPLYKKTFFELKPGQAVRRTFDLPLPPGLPSGEYGVRIVVISLDGARDTDTTNNSFEAENPLVFERAPVSLLPGKLKGMLGPRGRQTFVLSIVPGLKASVKAVLKKVSATKTLTRDGDTSPLATAEGKKALKAKLKEVPEGDLVLTIESGSTSTAEYIVSFKAGKIRVSGEMDVGPDPVEIEIPGYPRQRFTVVVKGLSGLVPVLDLAGLSTAANVKAKGTKASAKKLLLMGAGPWAVRVSGEGGAAGRVAYEVKVK